MICFPQLATGATAQYPIVKRRTHRTLVNRTSGGGVVKLADPQAAATEWEFSYSGLSEAEWGAIEGLFLAAQGRAGDFVFLDPNGNLLLWSEDLANAIWTRDPMLQATGGMADPWGTLRATRVTNAGQAAQRIVQTIAAPAGLQYCLSVYARSGTGVEVRLLRGASSQPRAVASGWERLSSSGKLAGSGESIAFGVELPAGNWVDLAGMQVEAQIGASAYKKTTTRSGVHARARFDQDYLRATAEGPDQYGCAVRIVSRD